MEKIFMNILQIVQLGISASILIVNTFQLILMYRRDKYGKGSRERRLWNGE